jgi:hypothetical protein
VPLGVWDLQLENPEYSSESVGVVSVNDQHPAKPVITTVELAVVVIRAVQTDSSVVSVRCGNTATQTI